MYLCSDFCGPCFMKICIFLSICSTRAFLQLQKPFNVVIIFVCQEWIALDALEAATKGLDVEEKSAWEIWGSHRIFVKNDTGHDIAVYVARFRKIREVTELHIKLGGASSSANFETSLKWALTEGRVQKTDIKAGETSKKLFYLGRSGGGTLTALSGDGFIFGENIHVPGGGLARIHGNPGREKLS